MLKKILIALVAAVAVLAIVIATRPAAYKVERSAVVAAPPAVVWAQLSDFGRWAAWSPWEKLDPAMKKEVTGTPGTPGHAYHWVGNKDVGEGRMTIVTASPGTLLSIKLEFLKPFEATSDTAFTTAADGAGTRVTWAMSGQNSFMGKAMSLFMDMDKAVGGDFERGLASLAKVSAEEAARATPPAAAPAAAPAQ